MSAPPIALTTRRIGFKWAASRTEGAFVLWTDEKGAKRLIQGHDGVKLVTRVDAFMATCRRVQMEPGGELHDWYWASTLLGDRIAPTPPADPYEMLVGYKPVISGIEQDHALLELHRAWLTVLRAADLRTQRDVPRIWLEDLDLAILARHAGVGDWRAAVPEIDRARHRNWLYREGYGRERSNGGAVADWARAVWRGSDASGLFRTARGRRIRLRKSGQNPKWEVARAIVKEKRDEYARIAAAAIARGVRIGRVTGYGVEMPELGPEALEAEATAAAAVAGLEADARVYRPGRHAGERLNGKWWKPRDYGWCERPMADDRRVYAGRG